MVVPPTSLNLLRKKLRQQRQYSADNAENRNEAAFRRSALFDDVLNAASSVGSYLPCGGEPDPARLTSKATSFPVVAPGHRMMTFHRWSAGDPLDTTLWGGQQPAATAERVEPDLILVPMLGFDHAFNRIGQGGGYYDRYLAAHPRALRIGIAWDVQRLDHIDARPWDVAMDAILTETSFHVKDLTRCRPR